MKLFLSRFFLHKKATVATLVIASVVIVTSILVAMPFGIFGESVEPISTIEPIRTLRNVNTDNLDVIGELEPTPDDVLAFEDIFDPSTNSASEPTIIETLGELLGLVHYVNTNSCTTDGCAGFYFALGADIDMSERIVSDITTSINNISNTEFDYVVSGTVQNTWVPIGNHENKFRGNFSGRNPDTDEIHTISNMVSIVQVLDSGTAATSVTLTRQQEALFNTYLGDMGIDEYIHQNPQNLSDIDNIPQSEAYAGLFGFIDGGTVSNLNMASPVAIAQQRAFFNLNTPPTLTMIQNGDLLQNVTLDTCPTARTWVVDARDGRTYWIRRIPRAGAGGVDICWMETNLAYAGGVNAANGGVDTFGDVMADLVQQQAGGLGNVIPRFAIPNPPSAATPIFSISPTPPRLGSGNATGLATNTAGAQYGFLYNWCAVMGGQAAACDTSSTTGFDPTISICPAGWRLPVHVGNNDLDTSDFAALVNALNVPVNNDANLRFNWLAVSAGSVNATGGFVDTNGTALGSRNYWSGTVENGANARNLVTGNTSVQLNNNQSKAFGAAVRCVNDTPHPPLDPTISTPTFFGFAQAGAVVGKTTGQLNNITVVDATILSSGNNGFAGSVAGSLNSQNIPDTTNILNVSNLSASDAIVVAGGVVNQTAVVSQSGQAGGLIGGLGAVTETTNLTITNNQFVGGTIFSSEMAGGITAGYFNNTGGSVLIEDITISADRISFGKQGGGVIGSLYAFDTSPRFNRINVDIESFRVRAEQVGGIVGWLFATGDTVFNSDADNDSISVNIDDFTVLGVVTEETIVHTNGWVQVLQVGEGAAGGVIGSFMLSGSLEVNNIDVSGEFVFDPNLPRGHIGGFAGHFGGDEDWRGRGTGLLSFDMDNFEFEGSMLATGGSAAGVISQFNGLWASGAGQTAVELSNITIKSDITANEYGTAAGIGLTWNGLVSFYLNTYTLNGSLSGERGASGVISNMDIAGNASFRNITHRGRIGGDSSGNINGEMVAGLVNNVSSHGRTDVLVENFNSIGDFYGSRMVDGDDVPGMVGGAFAVLNVTGIGTGNYGNVTARNITRIGSLDGSQVGGFASQITGGRFEITGSTFRPREGQSTLIEARARCNSFWNDQCHSWELGGAGGVAAIITRPNNTPRSGDNWDTIVEGVHIHGDINAGGHAGGMFANVTTSNTCSWNSDWTEQICPASVSIRNSSVNGNVMSGVAGETTVNQAGGIASVLNGQIGRVDIDEVHIRGNVQATDVPPVGGWGATGSQAGGMFGQLVTGFDGSTVAITNSSVNGNVTSYLQTGGLVGDLWFGNSFDVNRVFINGNVIATVPVQDSRSSSDGVRGQAGGLVATFATGWNPSSTTIRNSRVGRVGYADGNIRAAGQAGGLMGDASFGHLITIEDTHVTGNITSDGDVAGGLFAHITSNGHSPPADGDGNPVLATNIFRRVSVTGNISGYDSAAGIASVFVNNAASTVTIDNITISGGSIASDDGRASGAFNMLNAARSDVAITNFTRNGAVTGRNASGFADIITAGGFRMTGTNSLTGRIEGTGGNSTRGHTYARASGLVTILNGEIQDDVLVSGLAINGDISSTGETGGLFTNLVVQGGVDISSVDINDSITGNVDTYGNITSGVGKVGGVASLVEAGGNIVITNVNVNGDVDGGHQKTGGMFANITNWGTGNISITGGGVDGNVEGGNQVGGIAAVMSGSNNVTITNVNVDGNVEGNGQIGGMFASLSPAGAISITGGGVDGDVEGIHQAGGIAAIVGGNNGLTLTSVNVDGNVIGGGQVGGVFGVIGTWGDDIVLSGITQEGDVEGNSSSVQVGLVTGVTPHLIIQNNSSFDGDVTATNGMAGLLGAHAGGRIRVTDTTFEGDVIGGSRAGALMAVLSGDGHGNSSSASDIDDGLGWWPANVYLENINATGFSSQASEADTLFRNITLINNSVTSANGEAGGLFAHLFGADGVYIRNVDVDTEVSALRSAGGIAATVGSEGLLSINGLTVNADIQSTGESFDDSAGGVFGSVGVGDILVNGIRQIGNVTGYQRVGGFAGGAGGVVDNWNGSGVPVVNQTGRFHMNDSRFHGDINQTNIGPCGMNPNISGWIGCTGEAGGIIGGIGENYSDVVFTNVRHRGDVIGMQVGGLVGATRNIGLHQTAKYGGNVMGRGHATGGLVGSAVKADISESLVMSNVVGQANVFAVTYVGGLIGGNVGSNFDAIENGWIMSWENNVEFNIANSFFAGDVVGGSGAHTFVGGLVGGATNGTSNSNLNYIEINNAYVVGNVSASGGGTNHHGSVVGHSVTNPSLSSVY
ncbi:MAG: hypothetical protein LBG64_01790, partial [Pseudomonadales bacterium]|nr:hypothetical protein [Pseudomonadales bacterium]